ncbi:MAG: FAD-dependent monooxygenase [Rhodobacteraceae bacterium]|nr:FAD-dependent monooxygenase [Paracoccaceae bacterium]
MEKRLDIGIVGCGIGGLALAALLGQRGHQVTIFDKFDAPTAVGSGLVIQPVGLDVLRAVGAAEYALEKGQKLTHMLGHETKSKQTVLQVSYGKRFGLAIHRASLFESLFRVAVDAGCVMRTSADVSGTELSGDKRLVILNEKSEAFDLVVDASGAGSVLTPMPRKPLSFGALWATVDWPEGTDLPVYQLSQCYKGAAHMVGVLPIGCLPDDNTNKAAIFWSLPQNAYADWQAQPIATWKAQAADLWPKFAPFLDQINTHDDLTMAFYHHGTLKTPHTERLAFIGDAAHCASPQLGQGANMALLDALALADMLERFPLEKALPAYAKSRRRHVWVYQWISRLFTPVYQSNSKILPWLRNWLFAPLMRVPPIPWILKTLVSGNIVAAIKRGPK